MRWIGTACLALAGLLGADIAAAQAYPAKPIKIVVTFAPGGGSDYIARLIAQKLTERIGMQVIVDNRPGAGGNIGAEAVVKSPPDGYTLLLSSASYTVNPSLYKLPFDPMGDITPIIQLSKGPYVVAVHPSVPANTFAELVALAKREPGKLAFGSSGSGGHMHISTEYLLDETQMKMIHIPYKGTGPALTDAISGNIQLVLGSVATTLQYVKAGKLRALAVTTPKRIAAAPDIPTVAESGYPNWEVTNWHGLVGPKGLPREIVERLNREVNEVLKSKDVEKILGADGLEPAGGTPDELAAAMRMEIARWARVVKHAGVKIE
jgi:tripartite-type tricarboxylate transporter receptor subunit TctC